MNEASSGSRVSILRLVLIPGLITLGVTILRLVGELQHWSKVLFNPAPGGGGGIVGIVWLVPIFGIYFALKLAAAGDRPKSLGKAVVWVVVGLVLMVGGGVLGGLSQFRNALLGFGGLVLMAAAVVIPILGWPALTKALIAYGYLARIPVAIIMFFAIRANWGTHYDAPPPGFPEMGFWGKYIMIGLVPQLVLWIAFTVILGSLLGIIVAAIASRAGTPVAGVTTA
ncbi:MAG TPA: hypothetical protein VFD30_10370 [Terriglobia bacterium]|jgi:hypothetical protein|nr:hypothetical protein [Terriglobia bacterium]